MKSPLEAIVWGDGSQDATVGFYANQIDMAGNESDCSARIGYTLDVTAPLAPTGLALEAPSTSPSTDSTPTIKVSGVEGGATVTIYRDSICTDAISDSVKVNRWASEVSVTSYGLGNEGQDVQVQFYVRQVDEAGNESPCSSASVSYIYDAIAPMKPTGLALEAPNTSPNTDSTPTIRGKWS